jgi:hypothetical protein
MMPGHPHKAHRRTPAHDRLSWGSMWCLTKPTYPNSPDTSRPRARAPWGLASDLRKLQFPDRYIRHDRASWGPTRLLTFVKVPRSGPVSNSKDRS